MTLGASGAAVAVKLTLPARPAAVAFSVYCPDVFGSVQLPSVAIPDRFVVAVAPVRLLPTVAIANVTATPETGLPLAAFTTAAGRVPTAVLTVAWSVVGLLAWS